MLDTTNGFAFIMRIQIVLVDSMAKSTLSDYFTLTNFRIEEPNHTICNEWTTNDPLPNDFLNNSGKYFIFSININESRRCHFCFLEDMMTISDLQFNVDDFV